MKVLKILALMLATAAFLAACTTSTTVTNGTLTVTVNTPEVLVTVVGGTTNQTVTIDSARSWSLAPGTYTVTASKAGFTTPTTQTATVTAGGQSTVALTLTELDAINGNVGSIDVSSVVDVLGSPFPQVDEVTVNDYKTFIMAAQTEEYVCVTLDLTNEAGDPLQNAPVQVAVTNTMYDSVVVIPGACSNDAASSSRDFVTDDNGQVTFQLFATLDSAPYFYGRSEFGDILAKVVVTAQGADNVTELLEFKAFFANITHLYQGDEDLDEWVYTDQRVGADMGTITNIWEEQSGIITEPTVDNTHDLWSGLAIKQPTSDIATVSGDNNGFPFYYGVMQYVITDSSGNVEWDYARCEELSGDTCTMSSTDYVTLVPTGDLEDLPMYADVTASLWVGIEYGTEDYEFMLKDYSFTKQWVGGYLEIDKYVDQHVLTWAGEGSEGSPTRDASVSAWTLGDEFLSTVYLTVSNPSTAALTNLTVFDSVPEELGVVESSISNGGTYDEDKHTITWNNLLGTGELAVDESITVSFDVYARHKPGYPWAGATADNVVVKSPAVLGETNYPHVVSDTNFTNASFESLVYNDPYKVVNGEQYGSVTATANNGSQQLTWVYSPVSDESDIWVVRPFLTIDKVRTTPLVMPVTQSADYTITVGQIDRVSTTVDTGWTEYAFLNTLYPWEFNGALGAGSGHEADSSAVRDNPYARDIEVNDSFEVGLDFTQGVDFDGSLIFPSSTQVVGNDVEFSIIENLSRGTTTTASVKLQGDHVSELSPEDTDPDTDKKALYVVSGQDESFAAGGDGEMYAWLNCAYLGSDQLNQPWTGTTEFTEDTIYELWTAGSDSQYPFIPTPTPGDSGLWVNADAYNGGYYQVSVEGVSPTELVENVVTGATRIPGHTTTGSVDGFVESCVPVVVAPFYENPFLTLSNNGEAPTAQPGDAQNENFSDGDTYYHRFTIQNIGVTQATNVQLIVSNTDFDNADFDAGGAIAYSSMDNGGTWVVDNAITPWSFTAERIEWRDMTIESGEWIRFVIKTTADASGLDEVTAIGRHPQVTGNVFGTQVETTNIKP